jgi:hypothetical protein
MPACRSGVLTIAVEAFVNNPGWISTCCFYIDFKTALKAQDMRFLTGS